MIKKSLKQLYEEHQGKVSDKWSIYLSEYDRIFAPYRDGPTRLLEIGIQNGGSLDIWAQFFPNAQNLIGCDINPDCAKLTYADSRISVVVGDANTDMTEIAVLSISPQFDVIIDDGSHRSSDIVKSFAKYWPHIIDEGVFVAEDLHCSYWQGFEGGLFDAFSSINFFKRLADIISHEHWGVAKNRTDILTGFFAKYGFSIQEADLQHIHSVEFINSVCVIRKSKPINNILGVRFIAGTDEKVIQGHSGLHLSLPTTVDENTNQWSNRLFPPDEELIDRLNELNENKIRLAAMNSQLAECERQLAERDGQLAERDGQLAERDGQLAERDGQLAERDGQLAERDGQLAERDGQLPERDGQLPERDGQLALLGQQIAALHHSSSWRITAPLRFTSRQIKRVPRDIKLALPALKLGGGVTGTFKKAVKLFLREGIPGVKRGFRMAAMSIMPVAAPAPAPALAPVTTPAVDNNDYAEWVRRYDTLTSADRANMRAHQADFPHKPLISVLMPTYNTKPEWLIEAIESVRSQIYPHWELCIADDASPDPAVRPILERYAQDDARIKVIFRPQNGHISAASNSALELVTGEWVALLDHDDLLSENALFWVAHSINANPDLQLIYSDEDKINEIGTRSGPYFKCDWNRDLFYSHNLITHLGVYRTDLVKSLNGFRVGFEGAQDYDLALRYIEKIKENQIHHIPYVLYHWRMHEQSTAQSADAKPYAMQAGEKALNQHLQRIGVNASATMTEHGYRVRYALPEAPPLVSLIIPTRNGLALMRQCIQSILEKTEYSNYEIIIIDNGSDDVNALEYFKYLSRNPLIRILRDDGPFNYSALNNAAVMQAKGDLIGLINNDIEVISRDWLSEMVSHALRPGIGAVGAKLWYPDDTLQHGGVVLGIGGVAAHVFKKIPKNSASYFSRSELIQSYSAVTAACLVVQKNVYEQVGGLNEVDLKIAFNDVDFCLRITEAGYRNVWTPFAELYHHESASRGLENTPEKQARFNQEVAYMMERWNNLLLNDPAYSPNLTLEHEDFSLAWPPRTQALSVHSSLVAFMPSPDLPPPAVPINFPRSSSAYANDGFEKKKIQ